MVVRIKATIRPNAVNRVVGPMADASAYRAAQKMRGYAMSNIIARGRIDTGAMMRGLQVRRLPDTTIRKRYDVSIFQEYGTRAHGPVRAQFLRFQIRGVGPVIFTKWVRGVTAAHFMRDAKNKLAPKDYLP
jgi:hypothetical protein